MGRHSGFIACYAALASHDVDFVLIPEVPFAFDGPAGFTARLRERVRRQGHAVVVAAEGAGQDLFDYDGAVDASGNARLADVGGAAAAADHRGLRGGGRGGQPALRRPRVRDPQRARQRVGRGLLPAAGAGGGARRDGRADGDGRRALARAVRAHPDPGRDRQAATRSTPTATCGCRCSRRPGSRPGSADQHGQ